MDELQETEIHIKDYLRLLVRRRWTVLAVRNQVDVGDSTYYYSQYHTSNYYGETNSGNKDREGAAPTEF